MVFLFTHGLLESNLLQLNLAQFVIFGILLLADSIGLRLVNGQLVVCGGVLGNLTVQIVHFALETLRVRGEALKLSLGGLRLLQKHLDSLEALTFVVKFATDDIVADFTVLSGFVSQIVEHLFGAKVLAGNLLGIHETLTD